MLPTQRHGTDELRCTSGSAKDHVLSYIQSIRMIGTPHLRVGPSDGWIRNHPHPKPPTPRHVRVSHLQPEAPRSIYFTSALSTPTATSPTLRGLLRRCFSLLDAEQHAIVGQIVAIRSLGPILLHRPHQQGSVLALQTIRGVTKKKEMRGAYEGGVKSGRNLRLDGSGSRVVGCVGDQTLRTRHAP